jgi:hypothetical protein
MTCFRSRRQEARQRPDGWNLAHNRGPGNGELISSEVLPDLSLENDAAIALTPFKCPSWPNRKLKPACGQQLTCFL